MGLSEIFENLSILHIRYVTENRSVCHLLLLLSDHRNKQFLISGKHISFTRLPEYEPSRAIESEIVS